MELWDLYTENREKTGKTMVRGEKQPDGFYRIVVHVCIFNAKNQLLIQQRVPFKDDWKNLWDITVSQKLYRFSVFSKRQRRLPHSKGFYKIN